MLFVIMFKVWQCRRQSRILYPEDSGWPEGWDHRIIKLLKSEQPLQ